MYETNVTLNGNVPAKEYLYKRMAELTAFIAENEAKSQQVQESIIAEWAKGAPAIKEAMESTFNGIGQHYDRDFVNSEEYIRLIQYCNMENFKLGLTYSTFVYFIPSLERIFEKLRSNSNALYGFNLSGFIQNYRQSMPTVWAVEDAKDELQDLQTVQKELIKHYAIGEIPNEVKQSVNGTIDSLREKKREIYADPSYRTTGSDAMNNKGFWAAHEVNERIEVLKPYSTTESDIELADRVIRLHPHYGNNNVEFEILGPILANVFPGENRKITKQNCLDAGDVLLIKVLEERRKLTKLENEKQQKERVGKKLGIEEESTIKEQTEKLANLEYWLKQIFNYGQNFEFCQRRTQLPTLLKELKQTPPTHEELEAAKPIVEDFLKEAPIALKKQATMYQQESEGKTNEM